MVKVPPVTTFTTSTWLVEPNISDRNAVFVARGMVNPGGGKIPVRVLNPRSESVTVQRGVQIAVMEPLQTEEVDLASTSVSSVEQTTGLEVSEEKRKQLWQIVLDIGDKLSVEEQEQLYAMLLEHAELFAEQPDDFGRTDKIRHAINTGNAPPVRQQVRRIPPIRREAARKLLSDMLNKDVIRPSSSPWASPIVLVPKKDGSVRFCVDYRKVNDLTRKDAYPLPRVDDTLDTLSGSKWFSTLDLISGYWQVEVAEEDREKTAFCTPDGLFEFKVMPFGLCNAPATFQRLMDMVLGGLQWTNCLVYLDDVIVVGRTFREHLQNLRSVFSRLSTAGLKLQPKKCHLCSPQVEFLGHVVSAEGVSTDPKKIEKVANWPVPTSKREVQQFLGLANYYRRFMEDFARIAKPLHRLTEKTVDFAWDRLEVHDGVLWRVYDDNAGKRKWLQLILPLILRDEVLQELHAGVISGHLGEQKMLHQLRERFYWPGMSEDVKNWCQTCATCATRKSPAPKARAPMQTLQAGYPMQVIAVDIAGPFPESEEGNSYVMVVGDYFSKWVEAFAIPDQEASTVATKLVDEVYCRFSPPEQLHSDQGRQFESELMKEVCKILRISKSRATPYHPQGDGLVERFNCTLKQMLATTLHDYPFDWEERLRKVCMAYNTSVHSSTGYTPFYLMYGREARLPIDIAYGTKTLESESVGAYATRLRKSLTEAYSDVQHQLETSHKRQKEVYDKKVHGKPYKEEDLVWLYNPAVPPGQSKKLHHPWTGPFKVLERIGEANYRIKEVYGKKAPLVVHFDRLKRCHPGTRFIPRIDRKDSHNEASNEHTSTNVFEMEIVEADYDEHYLVPLEEDAAHGTPPVRRSTRNRQQPERLLPVVTH